MKKINKRFNQNNLGITLVSLVVTIIILLILAGVSLNSIMGDEGIIGEAEMAVEDYEKARLEEEQRIKEVATTLAMVTNRWDGKIPDKDIKEQNPGKGSKENPYTISNGSELASFIKAVNNGKEFKGEYVEITRSINLNNHKIEPIGLGTYEDIYVGGWSNDFKGFDGHLDGKGNIITGVNIDVPDACGVGFIGLLAEGGVVENLNIYDGIIKGKTCVGGIAGINSGGTIKNCTNRATIIAIENENVTNSGTMAGGIIGWLEKGFVENCANYGSVTAKNDNLLEGRGEMAGGIVGAAYSTYETGINKAEIKGCINNGNVKAASNDAGGIVGLSFYNVKECTVEKCINKANVETRGSNAGGIVGRVGKGTCNVRECENIGEIIVGAH